MTCLHHYPKDARDISCHFFNCVKFKDREEFLDSLWEKAVENPDVVNKPRVLWAGEEPETPCGENAGLEFRYVGVANLKDELEWISTIRRELANSEMTNHLVRNVDESRRYWRACCNLSGEPEKVAKRLAREITEKLEELAKSGKSKCNRAQPRDSARDKIEAGKIPQNPAKGTSINMAKEEYASENEDGDKSSPFPLSYDIEMDVKAQYILMEPVAGSPFMGLMVPRRKCMHGEAFTGQFPHQQLSMKHLVGKEFCKLDFPGSEKMIQYFHVPYNNMIVSSKPNLKSVELIRLTEN